MTISTVRGTALAIAAAAALVAGTAVPALAAVGGPYTSAQYYSMSECRSVQARTAAVSGNVITRACAQTGEAWISTWYGSEPIGYRPVPIYTFAFVNRRAS